MTIETIRNERNILLAASDYLLLPDTNLNTAEYEDVLAYRIMLRDTMSGMTEEMAANHQFVKPTNPRVRAMLNIL